MEYDRIGIIGPRNNIQNSQASGMGLRMEKTKVALLGAGFIE
jgi:hypothetical protein